MTRASRASCRSSPELGLWLATFLFGLGCEGPAAPSASSGTASAPPPPASAPLSPPAPAAAAPAPLSPPAPAAAARPAISGACRVVSLSGVVRRGEQALRAGDLLGDPRAVELGPASSLHLVHTASARQWTLTGPARFFACDGGAEEIVLARGTLRTEPGAGVRPGAEVWVGTPHGSVRYSDARAELDVAPARLKLQVATGSVWFNALGAEAERELSGKTATFAAPPERLTRDATARCERDASAAEARARALLSPSVEPLGARAAAHVRARQQAHASCSSALASVLAASATDAAGEAQAGYSALARAERRWRGVPDPARPAVP